MSNDTFIDAIFSFIYQSAVTRKVSLNLFVVNYLLDNDLTLEGADTPSRNAAELSNVVFNFITASNNEVEQDVFKSFVNGYMFDNRLTLGAKQWMT